VAVGTSASGRAADPVQPLYTLPFLHVGPASGPAALPQVLDPAGRVVLLRGVNVNGLEDYWADSATPLATPYPTSPAAYAGGACPQRNPAVESMAVCALDFPQLQALGYDSIRLGVSWSLLEPAPGVIDSTYIDRIQQVVGWAKDRGLYVVIDMHQDAWSKYVYTAAGQLCPPTFKTVGGFHESDGAPGWASTAVTPTCALNGTRELDTAVQENFQKLWSDLPGPDSVGLQEHYAAVMLALARRFIGESTVAGYEIMNEPSPGLTAPDVMAVTELFPFYAKVIGNVTSAIPGFRQLFFVEPDITRDITDQSLVLVPWSTFSGYPNVVYAPHVYTRVFTPDAALNAPALDAAFPLDGGYRSAVTDAVNLGLPLWVGEFGNDVADDETFLRTHYANSDADGIGNSLWVWKAELAAGFSVYHGPFGEGSAFPSRVKFTSRVYPLFTAGQLDALEYQPDTGMGQLRATSPATAQCDARARATILFVPASATGTVTAVNAGLEVLAVPGGRMAFVYPAGGIYGVSVGPAGTSAVTSSCLPAAIPRVGWGSTPATSTGVAGPAGAAMALLVALAAAVGVANRSGIEKRRSSGRS
jgi:endoglycosylceramidase